MFSIFPKDDQDQTLRIKRFLLAFGAYLIWSVICYAAYFLGLTTVSLVVLSFGVAASFCVNILLYVVFRTGLNKKFEDPSLTLLQMVIATFWIMVVMYYAYEARSAILLVYMVVLVFGFFRLNVRQFLILSLYAVINFSTVIYLAHQIHPESVHKSVDIFNIIVLACILPWFAMVGGYITRLRTRLTNTLTTYRVTESKLRDEEQRFRALADQSSDIIILFNKELLISYKNPALEKVLGFTTEDLLGTNLYQYVHPDDLKLVVEIFTKQFPDPNAPPTHIELRIRHKDGSWHTFEAMGSNLVRNNVVEAAIANLHDITERKESEEKLKKTLESLKRAAGTTIQVLVSASESRDPYTAGHQYRAANLACAIATEMGLSQDKIDGIRMAGSIHDIGKLSVPAEILTKPAKLTKLEFSLIQEHAHSGYEMLKDVESPWPLAEIVYQHHERMDGSGYPRNLKGDEIIMEARILAVSDVVEAMASHRPYRPSLGIEAALEEIRKNKGILYDNDVAEACLRLFQEKGYQLT
ncbi:MAG: HD-GYP domain-containing protein [Syntrophaceae bacterium]|nr:HD-GYP domain-containing protein [Syntrophaceae bacterium]